MHGKLSLIAICCALLLAGYNIGYFHLRDAMQLARRKGRKPNRWVDVKKMLPKLMRKRYYRTVK